MPNEDLSGTQRAAALAAQAPESDTAFLERSREEFQADKQRDQQDRAEALDDHKFTFSSDLTVRNENGIGSQWSDKAFKQRKSKRLPIMQWNRMHIYQQHVENQGRQNDFAIKVSQADGGEKDTAEYYQDRIRQIEYDSNFTTVSSIARSNQLSAGRGWFRISTKYRKGTFEQYACLDEVPDAFSIYTGPHKELDCSDAERMWEIYYLTKAQYKRAFGQKRLDETVAFADDQASNMAEWVDVGTSGQMIQIARKYQKEIKKRVLYQAADGVTGIPEDEIDVDAALQMGILDVDDQGRPIQREEETCEVWCYLIDGAHILKKEQFIVDEIPIVPVWGLCTVLDGIQRHFSMGNRAKEPQRLLNLAISNLAALVGAQSKAQFMMDLAQIEKQHLNDWAGLTNAVLLLYNRRDANGNDLGVPQQVVNPPQIAAVLEMYREAVEGLKAAYGIFDAQLGRTQQDQSGKAIQKLKEQGEQVNFHFVANEAIAHKRLGQILVKVIQKVDPEGSTRMVRTEAGKTHAVPIGQPFKHYRTGKESVIQPKSDVELGITVDMGPSYQSARQQVNETDMAMLSNLPPDAGILLMPEILRTQDAPNSEGRAEIFERYINSKMPGILPPKEDEGPQLPPEVVQQLEAQSQELQKLQAFAQQLHEQIQTDQVKAQADAVKQDKELAYKKWEAELKAHIEMAKIGSAEDRLLLEKELGHAQTLEQSEMEATEADRAREHESAEAEAARTATSTEAEKARMAAAEQAKASQQHELAAAELAAKREQELANQETDE